eukprot:scaffold53899_cov20-Tisochrysis_lutea.AAC.1
MAVVQTTGLYSVVAVGSSNAAAGRGCAVEAASQEVLYVDDFLASRCADGMHMRASPMNALVHACTYFGAGRL